MKLYEDRSAPNPRRVRIFLAEKGIADIECVPVPLADDAQFTAEFLARNPLGWVPVLELDDGRYLSETIAICRYFEHLHPAPCLFGRPGEEAAFVEMWQRHMEFEIFWPIAHVFRNIHPFFKGKHPQVAEYGEVQRAYALRRLAWLERVMADGREFIAGEAFTVADITALCGIDFGRVSGIRLGDEHPRLKAWHARVSARPSAKA
jgi:glutathione S-transferase